MDSLIVLLVVICRMTFAGQTRDAVAGLYPTAEEARITCAIVDAARQFCPPLLGFPGDGRPDSFGP